MSIFKDDKERKEFYTTRDKKEDNSVVEPKATEPTKKAKDIYDLKTFDELLEYYYLIPKVIEIDNYKGLDIKELLEQITLKTKEKTNINLVKRGKRKKRISDEQQELIRNSKKTNEELSKIYNVSASTISNIKNNKY